MPSHSAWILVVGSPHEQPIAWFCCPLLRPLPSGVLGQPCCRPRRGRAGLHWQRMQPPAPARCPSHSNGHRSNSVVRGLYSAGAARQQRPVRFADAVRTRRLILRGGHKKANDAIVKPWCRPHCTDLLLLQRSPDHQGLAWCDQRSLCRRRASDVPFRALKVRRHSVQR